MGRGIEHLRIPGQAVLHQLLIKGGNDHVVIFPQAAGDVGQYILLLLLLILVQRDCGIYQTVNSHRGFEFAYCSDCTIEHKGIGSHRQSAATGQGPGVEQQLLLLHLVGSPEERAHSGSCHTQNQPGQDRQTQQERNTFSFHTLTLLVHHDIQCHGGVIVHIRMLPDLRPDTQIKKPLFRVCCFVQIQHDLVFL